MSAIISLYEANLQALINSKGELTGLDFNLRIFSKVISGENCVINNSEKLKKIGSSCLIVTGKNSAQKCGVLSDLVFALEKEDISYEVFSNIGPNPLLCDCKAAGDMARKMKAEFIVGAGGGSVLDAAKAAAIFCTNPEFCETDIYINKERNKALPLVFIGTTAGTGSEVGRVSVLTNEKTGRKKSIAPSDGYGTLTLADPKYTYTVPFYQTVSTALDAFSHAVEGYFSKSCGDIAAMFAERAIAMLWKSLRVLYEKKDVPNEETRNSLYYGSLYAGITLDYCGTAFPHPLGYVLTENYGLPHGMACAVFLDDFLDRCERFETEKLSRVLELTNESKDSIKEVIVALRDDKGIKMSKEDIERYCSRWNEELPGNFKKSPGGYTKEEAEKAFLKFVR